MSFSFPPPSPPPPASANVGGETTDTFVGAQPQYTTTGNGINANGDVFNDTSSPPQSLSSSISIFIIVIASAIIVSASVYLLLRFLSRRRQQQRASRSFSATVPEEILSRHRSNSKNISGRGSFFESLPIFTFGSVTGNLSAVDCAVCLSKFEAEDQLRLLPICCHAFHAHCIDTWLSSNMTCPLCRSAVNTADSDDLTKILTDENVQSRRNDTVESNGGSFRIEMGSISRGRGESESGRRSYSVGSFDYIIDDGYEVSFDSTHRRGQSGISIDKESVDVASTAPPGESLARDVAGCRSWLRDYFDRFGSFSFRSSERYSGRQSEVVVPVEELEGERMGEEITEIFRWLSGV